MKASTGELIDGITILQIKAERLPENAGRAGVRHTLRALEAARDRAITGSVDLSELTRELKRVNERLWDLEDGVRDHERRRDFRPSFVEMARAVSTYDDRRWALKRRIDDLLGPRSVEEKSYRPYVDGD